MILRILLYAMLHPLTGSLHVAGHYGLSAYATGRVMLLAQGADFVLILACLYAAERFFKRKAAN